MDTISEQQATANGPQLPLDMQVAIQTVKLLHIILVQDDEHINPIPYFYNVNRYAADPSCNAIRSFVKEEIINLFQVKLEKKGVDRTGLPERLCNYSVETKDKSAYLQVGYVNRLTKNVINNIKDFQQIVRKESDFDANPYEINTLSGIINIRTGELLPHTPEKLNRNIVNAKFVHFNNELLNYRRQITVVKRPGLFHKFISEALLDKTKSDIENREMVSSFMEILASFIIGNNEHKLVYILLGAPNTGKSTLLDVLLGIFNEYGTTFNNSALMVSPRTSNDIRPDLITLKGKRLLVGSEANKSEKFDNALIKQVSGNDHISVRKPHKGNMITFLITGKLMLATNYCPKFSDLDDQAFLNRIVIIDFNNIPSNFDTSLKEKLMTPESRNEIFTFLVHTANKIVQNNKIFIHERFKTNKQRILVNQNSSVSLFWKAHIRPYKSYIIPVEKWPRHPVKQLYSVMYIDFCHRINVTPLPFEAFAKEFKSLSDGEPLVSWKKGESNNFYVGFNVVDGAVCQYKTLLMTAWGDKTKIDESNKFHS